MCRKNMALGIEWSSVAYWVIKAVEALVCIFCSTIVWETDAVFGAHESLNIQRTSTNEESEEKKINRSHIYPVYDRAQLREDSLLLQWRRSVRSRHKKHNPTKQAQVCVHHDEDQQGLATHVVTAVGQEGSSLYARDVHLFMASISL